MIVLYHVRGPLEHLGYSSGWAEGLASGVDIFFVISGFVMWVSTYGRKMPPLEFYRRRILRIVPLYWLITAVVLLVLLLAPGVVQSGQVVVSHVVASFLFLPAIHPVTGLIQPLLIPGWTLNAEMFFYVIFGACLLLPAAARIPATWLCLLIPVLLCRVIAEPGVALRFFGNSIMLDFGLGLILGAAVTAGMHLRLAAALTMLVLGAALLATLWDRLPHVLMVGVPAFAIVAGLAAIERAGRLPAIPPLRILGDASYSLYLSHSALLSALDQLARRVGLRAVSLPAAFGIGLLLTLIALVTGVVVYRAIEQPLAALVHRGGRSIARRRAA